MRVFSILVAACLGIGSARADGLVLASPGGPSTQGQCYASGNSGPRVPCVLQGQTWTRVLRPTDPADGLTVAPASGAPPNSLARSVFEALRGSTFYLRPFLSDLTCAVDQTSNVAVALALAPVGAEIVAPPGCIAAADTTTVTSRHLRGVGRSAGGTEWRYGSASGAAVKLMGDGARVSGILFTNPVSNTQATAVQIADGITNPRGVMVDHIRAIGFRDQLDVQSGEWWSASHLDFYNAVRYGVRIRNGVHGDSGDGVIHASTIYADSPIGDTAIRLESGGGLKITATKTLQFNKSLVLAVADGVNTSILMVDGSNSFENPRSGEAVRLGRIEGGTTGIYGHINISAQLTGAVGVYPGVENVRLAPLTRDTLFGVIIQGGDNITVASGTMLLRVDQGLIIQDPATNVLVAEFSCPGCRIKISDQRAAGAGRIALNEVRPLSLPAPNTSTAYVPLYEVEVPPYRGARLNVEVEGLLQGAGAVNTLLDVLAYHNGTTIPAPATVSNVQGGQAPVDIQFDTSTTPGKIRVGARVNSAYATSTLSGSMTLRVDGRVGSFRALP